MKKSRLPGAVCACLLSLTATPIYATQIGIYWTDTGTGTIGYAGLDGSGQTTLVSGLSNPRGLDVTHDYLYWTDRDDLLIRQANLDGSGVQIVHDTSTPISGNPRDLFVTDTYIYWTNTGDNDSISRVELDGTNATDLVTDTAATPLIYPNGIHLTDDTIYWSDSGALAISLSNLDGSGVTTVVDGFPSTQLPTTVRVTEEFIYWATRDLCLTRTGCTPEPGTIQRSNLDGTNIVTLIDNLIFPQDVVITSDYIYWTDQNAGKIQRSNLDGTGITDLVVGLTTPVGLSVIREPLPPTSVTIDIKPSKKPGKPNEIDPKKDKNLNVAIVGNIDFDPLQVDHTTVLFGPGDASPTRYRGQDYNRDGYSDLVLTFKLSETEIVCGVTEATLTGQTDTDPIVYIEGTDSFTIEGCP